MIFTIPYNPTLPGGYDKLAAAINRNGSHQSHTLFVTALPQHEDGAFDLAMKIREQFGRHFAVTIPAPPQPESAIAASNRAFLAALDALRNYEPAKHEMQEPVMCYHDPLWRPTRPRWLDEFQTEYYVLGAPTTFGNFKKLKNGTAKVVGPVVISRKFLKMTKLLDFPMGDTHWRNFLAWEIINNGLQSEALGEKLPAYIRPFAP